MALGIIAIKSENETGATKLAELEKKWILEHKELEFEATESVRALQSSGNVSQRDDKFAPILKKSREIDAAFLIYVTKLVVKTKESAREADKFANEVKVIANKAVQDANKLTRFCYGKSRNLLFQWDPPPFKKIVDRAKKVEEDAKKYAMASEKAAASANGDAEDVGTFYEQAVVKIRVYMRELFKLKAKFDELRMN